MLQQDLLMWKKTPTKLKAYHFVKRFKFKMTMCLKHVMTSADFHGKRIEKDTSNTRKSFVEIDFENEDSKIDWPSSETEELMLRNN